MLVFLYLVWMAWWVWIQNISPLILNSFAEFYLNINLLSHRKILLKIIWYREMYILCPFFILIYRVFVSDRSELFAFRYVSTRRLSFLIPWEILSSISVNQAGGLRSIKLETVSISGCSKRTFLFRNCLACCHHRVLLVFRKRTTQLDLNKFRIVKEKHKLSDMYYEQYLFITAYFLGFFFA